MFERRSRVVVCRRCYRTVAETPPTSYSRSSGRLVLACLFAHLGLPPNSDRCSWIADASTFRAQRFSSGCDCFSSPGNSQCVEFTFMDRTTSVDDTTALLSHLELSGFIAHQRQIATGPNRRSARSSLFPGQRVRGSKPPRLSLPQE